MTRPLLLTVMLFLNACGGTCRSSPQDAGSAVVMPEPDAGAPERVTLLYVRGCRAETCATTLEATPARALQLVDRYIAAGCEARAVGATDEAPTRHTIDCVALCDSGCCDGLIEGAHSDACGWTPGP